MTLNTDEFRQALKPVKPKAKRKKKAQTDDGKKRTMVRLNAQSWTLLEAVAKAEGTTASSVLDLALELFLVQYAGDELDTLLDQRRVDSNSPAYECMFQAGVSPDTLGVLVERLNLAELLLLR